MVLTRALMKEISSLADAKGRRRSGAFAAEGTKCVLDTVEAFTPRHILATEQWLAAHMLPTKCDDKIIVTGRRELGEVSSMSLTPDVIAVYELPEPEPFRPEDLRGRLTIALDRIQDPGNIGTIMRTADWMGITTILASVDTVDCFNPKAVQATMGAISRVKVIYGDLVDMLRRLDGIAVCGTFLDGDNIYTADLPSEAVIVMGNEGRGIGDDVAACVNRRLLIPPYPAGRPTSESLNVATATAIAVSQFVARHYGKD